MKRTALLALLALFACGLACCRRETAKCETAEGSPLQLFEKGRGVRLPDDMRKQLGVETAEVTEKLVAAHCDRPAQVFRAAEGLDPGAAVALVSEAEARSLRAGQSVSLRPGSDCGDSQPTTLTGTLARLETRTIAVLGQVEALIEFADPERLFPPRSLLTASFTSSRSNLVSAIPLSAVVEGVEGPFVYTANGSHYTRTLVKLGAASDGWVEVVDGLYAGDSVVTKAADTMWMIELCALKGGTPCCPVSKN
jgi:multidrug efflux pump subunit AcrA (membrane-fusion protein)